MMRRLLGTMQQPTPETWTLGLRQGTYWGKATLQMAGRADETAGNANEHQPTYGAARTAIRRVENATSRCGEGRRATCEIRGYP